MEPFPAEHGLPLVAQGGNGAAGRQTLRLFLEFGRGQLEVALEADAEIFRIGEARHDRNLGDRQVGLPEQLGGAFQPYVHDELLDRHARNVVQLLVEERPPDGHVRHERLHVVVVVVDVPLDVVHRLFQQFFVHGGDRDLRGFGDVFPSGS